MHSNACRRPACRAGLGRVSLLATMVLAIGASITGGAFAQQDRVPDGFIAGIQGPEDLVQLPGTPWVVVSSSRFAANAGPASLRVFDAGRPDAVRLLYPTKLAKQAKSGSAKGFAPHGLDVRDLGSGRFELLVVDHDGETIDRFTLRASRNRAPRVERMERMERIQEPPRVWLNSVAALPDGGIVATNMHASDDPGFMKKFAAGESTGNLLRWSAGEGWRSFGPPLSGPNGIVAAKDGKSVYVAEWSGRRLWQIPLDGGEPRSVPLAFLADNLRWTDAGDLLLAGQTTTPEQNFACIDAPEECDKGFVVVRIDPSTLQVTELFKGGSAGVRGFGVATTALQVGSDIFVGSVTGDRIARYSLLTGDRVP